MADKKSDQSSDIDQDVEFVSAKQSSDDQESVNMEKLLIGDAFGGLDEDAQEGLKNISKSELKMNIVIDDPVVPKPGPDEESKSRNQTVRPHSTGAPNPEVEPLPGSNEQSKPSRSSSRNSSLSEEVQTNIDVMYTLKARDADEKDVSVLKFSRLYLPDTEKRLRQMKKYNRHIMQDYPEFEDEISRKRKRDLKESFKKTMSMY